MMFYSLYSHINTVLPINIGVSCHLSYGFMTCPIAFPV